MKNRPLPPATMCKEFDCPQRGNCFRYRAFPQGRGQRYRLARAARGKTNGRCIAFIFRGDSPVRSLGTVDRENRKYYANREMEPTPTQGGR